MPGAAQRKAGGSAGDAGTRTNNVLSGDVLPSGVFSVDRDALAPAFDVPPGLVLNRRQQRDGLEFLELLPDAVVPVAFLDPQYRGVLDKLAYGNEGEKRGQRRSALPQMDERAINAFIRQIDRVLIPSGHLFLWMDKFHLCEGFHEWLEGTLLSVVDLVNWDKDRMGMGYRTRRQTEHCVVLQKPPRRAKGVWKKHNIPDTWREKPLGGSDHPHAKPIDLQEALIAAVSSEGDVVIDPAAGSFSVLTACEQSGRNFLGCDING